MYRRMCQQEAENVNKEPRGLKTKQPTQELWLSTSLKHSRQFVNKGVENPQDDVVMAFIVNLEEFEDHFRNEDFIDQRDSKSINKLLAPENLKNLVNDEILKDHEVHKI